MKGALQGEAVAPVVVYGAGPVSWLENGGAA